MTTDELLQLIAGTSTTTMVVAIGRLGVPQITAALRLWVETRRLREEREGQREAREAVRAVGLEARVRELEDDLEAAHERAAALAHQLAEERGYRGLQRSPLHLPAPLPARPTDRPIDREDPDE